MRKEIDKTKPTIRTLAPRKTVIAADTTFWGRKYGVTVFRSPTLKRNLWWEETEQETPDVYARGYRALKEAGWIVEAAVLDGKRGIAKVFLDVPVQMCHFHQVKTITKYLTRKPQSIAAQELRMIALSLARTDEETFRTHLAVWDERHRKFLDEHTLCGFCKRKHFIHRRLRSARHSLKLNLPFLFAYQKYPELHIPNTTNCLDGMFSQLKNRIAVHRGLNKARRFKIISEILSGNGENSN